MGFHFDPACARCKSPSGAVRAGTEISLCVLCDTPACEARVTITSFFDGASKDVALTAVDGGVGARVLFETEGVFFVKLTAGDWHAEFSQTVYDPAYSTPDWLAGGTMYQIFPDSFFADCEPDPKLFPDRLVLDKDKARSELPDKNGRYANEYYGGTLAGITQKLDYLSELGVSALYLNPIFEAHSSHRYNTADYMKIDPMLGNEDDFKRLCSRAHELGIRVILDGVFSHTGDDSVYFDKYGRYGGHGAYCDPNSEYFSWYHFNDYPQKYRCWWGIPTLPETEETRPEFCEFVCGDNGVLAKWLRLGADGFRLDVADELPREFIERLRARVKSENDGYVLGEVWEDATKKISYGEKRRYLLGHELDSVMNYPLRTAIFDYLRTGHAQAYREFVEKQLNDYPAPSLKCLMNLLSSHDTPRAITTLALDGNVPSVKSCVRRLLTKDEYLRGLELMKLAYVLLFTSVGVPCVYYGDEIGMQGIGDPDNRSYFDWQGGEQKLREHVRGLAMLRKRVPALAGTELEFVYARDGAVAYLRGDLFVALNMGQSPAQISVVGKNYTVPSWGYIIEEL